MTFSKTRNIERDDIEFKEVGDLGENDNGKEIGGLIQFRALESTPKKINSIDVFILDSLSSKEKYNLIKHEIGHASGLRQADSTNSMRWENMDERETNDIGICELYMVYWAIGLEQAYVIEEEYSGWTIAEFCPDEDGKYTGDDDEPKFSINGLFIWLLVWKKADEY